MVQPALVEALLLASRALVAVAAESLADDDVTMAQFRALVLLARSEEMTVSRFADALGIHPSTATRLCDRLVRKRWVSRVEGAVDRRETTLRLTAAGRRLVERVTARRRRSIAAIAGRIPADRVGQAIAGLEAFAEAAGELGPVDPFAWPATPLEGS